jgi:hypothetical protein
VSGCLLNVTSSKTNYSTQMKLLSVMLRAINMEYCVVSSQALQERVGLLDKQDINPDKLCIMNESRQRTQMVTLLTVMHNYFRKNNLTRHTITVCFRLV